MPLDLQVEGQLEAIFKQIEKQWGEPDICCIRSPSLAKPTSRAGSWIARKKDFSWRWQFHVGLSSARPNWPSR